ncbi:MULTISPECIES: hypothetical protein [Sandaracinus]|uniref:hypothetical protein n=1 Tax=Sandaracinus TaxID=1055688 RepID=UPI0019D45F31|nr:MULTISPECIES: hypothetical protein [Sandaracinus]UJR87321.1 Hypothetical protein I5071_1130 [Sandaracinus amylolyticus]
MTYLMPLVVIVVVVAFLILQRQRLAQAGQTYAPFELSKLAPRLGLLDRERRSPCSRRTTRSEVRAAEPRLCGEGLAVQAASL